MKMKARTNERTLCAVNHRWPPLDDPNVGWNVQLWTAVFGSSAQSPFLRAATRLSLACASGMSDGQGESEGRKPSMNPRDPRKDALTGAPHVRTLRGSPTASNASSLSALISCVRPGTLVFM